MPKYKKGMRKFSYFKQGTDEMKDRLDAADIPKYQKRKVEQALRDKRKKRQRTSIEGRVGPFSGSLKQ